MKRLYISVWLVSLMVFPGILLAAQTAGIAPELLRPVSMKGTFRSTEALKSVAEIAGKGLVLSKGVEDFDVDIDLYDAPIARALNVILYSRGYGFKVNASDLVILAVESKVFRLALPPVEQQLDTLTSNESLTDSSGVSDKKSSRVKVGTKVVVENSAQRLSFWEDTERNVRALLSPSGSMSLNRVGGVLLVTDTPVVLQTVEGFIDELNRRVSRQILVDVKVVEVELSNEHKLGIDWAALMGSADLKGLRAVSSMTSENLPAAGAFTLSGSADKEGSGDTQKGVNMLLRALDSYGRVEVVSQPRIAMLNNTVANIQVGSTRSYVESSNIETIQSGGTIVSGSLGEVHGGVTLQIVGNMVGDEIFLNVTPVVSSVDDIRSISLGNGSHLEAPETSMKSMNTMVRLKGCETAVIGGLITRNASKQHSGVPVLGRLPLLGRLFSYETVKRSRVELVIMITPRQG
ncbi:MAG: hypothetical protein HQL19_01050 [Candidatus Omnitrophica bacterium]|nr:hypothetical protein [Candidatus Omnitrophota bacterium]